MTIVNVKTPEMREVEFRLGKPLEKILPETVNQLGSVEAAGEVLGIRPNTLYMWLLRLGFVRKVEWVKTS